jgi:hypothetical protein
LKLGYCKCSHSKVKGGIIFFGCLLRSFAGMGRPQNKKILLLKTWNEVIYFERSVYTCDKTGKF